MPNILAHTYITSSVFGERNSDLVLGSTLPDFVSMYKARHGGFVAMRGLASYLDIGIAFHSKTDITFDTQPQIPNVTQPLAEDLEGAGLPNKAARLSANFAADILLDSALLDYDEALWSYRLLGNRVVTDSTSLCEFDEHFSRYVKRYFVDDAPRYYQNPRHIAAMIQHRLNSRSDEPEKTIANEQIPVLADVIGNHAQRAGELGLSAMQASIELLRAA